MTPEPNATTEPNRQPTDVTATLAPDAADRPSTHAHTSVIAPPGYSIERELGRGGMGVVYAAMQHGLNRNVALKMVLSAAKPDSRELARFFGEAEAVASVIHPGVVQVYEFGEHLGRPFLAMEYLPNGSLADRLRHAGRPTPKAAAELVAKVARAVQAAHDAGVVHRDLKPGNVLFDAAGEPRVTDFGLAKRGTQADLTRTNAVMGTPAYMAPEQARGRTKFVGPAADVYALGVILFELLTGRRPFEHEDAVELILQVADAPVPPVRRFAPDAPRELDYVCQKCLAKEPADRYPTAAALAADLTKFVAGEPLSVGRLNVVDRLRSTLDRSKHTAEFAAYAHIFLWMAGLVLAAQVVCTLAVQGHLDLLLIRVANFGLVVSLVGLLFAYRRGHWFPNAGGEMFLWALWGGYFICYWVNGQAHILRDDWHVDPHVRQMKLYQSNAILSALAFFAMAPVFWGWCYAFAVLFLVLDVVMAVSLEWAPLEFGTAWALILLATGLRLRRLARTQ